jgi:hypothetical protein
MDTVKLLKALDDNTNEVLLNYTNKKIKETNYNILKELHLSKSDTLELLDKLNGYRYVDEMSDLKYGTYLRWIPMNESSTRIHLTRGAIFCEMKINDNGVVIICKNHGFNSRHFQLKLDDNIIFQKLTDQEKVLLSALDHLAK